MRNFYLAIFFLVVFLQSPKLKAQNCTCTNCPILLPDNQNESVIANLVVETTNNNDLGINNFLEQVCVNIEHTLSLIHISEPTRP